MYIVQGMQNIEAQLYEVKVSIDKMFAVLKTEGNKSQIFLMEIIIMVPEKLEKHKQESQ